MIRHLKKLKSTLYIILNIFLARTFGTCFTSGWIGFDYVEYMWRGKKWFIPTGPYEAYNEDRMQEVRDVDENQSCKGEGYILDKNNKPIPCYNHGCH